LANHRVLAGVGHGGSGAQRAQQPVHAGHKVNPALAVAVLPAHHTRPLPTGELNVSAFLSPLAGGLLIGIAAVVLLGGIGRTAGISGIAWGAVSGRQPRTWRWLFIAGLPLGALAYHFASGAGVPSTSPLPLWQAALAGLLVGFGTQFGNGCTSGHGVCGLGLTSKRSFTATCTFMASGFITVYVMRHLLGVGA
jgi:uncharacterized membrane protein YedE/YeeE